MLWSKGWFGIWKQNPWNLLQTGVMKWSEDPATILPKQDISCATCCKAKNSLSMELKEIICWCLLRGLVVFSPSCFHFFFVSDFFLFLFLFLSLCFFLLLLPLPLLISSCSSFCFFLFLSLFFFFFSLLFFLVLVLVFVLLRSVVFLVVFWFFSWFCPCSSYFLFFLVLVLF